MQTLFLTAAVLTCGGADPFAFKDADARARAALALAVASRPATEVSRAGCDCPSTGVCACGADCPCASRESGRPAGGTAQAPAAPGYQEAYSRAVRQGRPLLLWVGLHCPGLERQLPDCVHYHCNSFDEDGTTRVIVATPRGEWLYQRVQFAGLPSIEGLRAWLGDDTSVTSAASATFGGACGPQGCGLAGPAFAGCGAGGCASAGWEWNGVGAGGCGPAGCFAPGPVGAGPVFGGRCSRGRCR